MPGVDLSSSKVAQGEVLNVTKFNSMVDSIQAEFADIDVDQIPGNPSAATDRYLRGDGQWAALPQVLLEDKDLTSSATFSSVAQGFRALKLVWFGRTTSGVVTDNVQVRFNGDTGANYDVSDMQGNNSTPVGAQAISQTSIPIGVLAGANATANRMGIGELTIAMYSSTAMHKICVGMSNALSTSAAADCWLQGRSGLWKNTAAITQIDLIIGNGGSWVSGSRAYLYGVNVF